MLRSAIRRPQAVQWIRSDRSPRPFFRHASSKSSPTRDQQTAPTKETLWSSSVREHAFRYVERLRTLVWLAPAVLAAFLFLHIETTYFYALDVTYGISMLPTINMQGDSVIISKLYRRGKNVRIGDMVSFDHPVDQQVQSIKRVVGLEGDWVCRDTPGVGDGKVIQVSHTTPTCYDLH